MPGSVEPDGYFAIDESGNSGPNLLDLGQPVLVHAGLLAPEGSIDALRTHALALKAEFLPKAAELHSGILNTLRGRRAVADLLEFLSEHCHAAPVALLVEKRYALAAHVVETCMDGAYNDRVPIGLTGAANEKQAIANTVLAGVSGEALREFGEALSEREGKALTSAVSRVAAELRSAGEVMYANAIEGCIPALHDQCKTLKRSDDQVSGFNALNIPTFNALLSMADVAASSRFCDTLVIHDDSPQGVAYDYVFGIHQSAAPGRLELDNGAVFVGRFEALRRFEQRPSHEEPLVQLADVIAGVIARVALPRGRRDEPELDPWVIA